MYALKRCLPSILLLSSALLAGLGIALQAADESGEGSPRDVLDPLLEQTEWKGEWIEELQAYRIAFKGPDVWVRLSGLQLLGLFAVLVIGIFLVLDHLANRSS